MGRHNMPRDYEDILSEIRGLRGDFGPEFIRGALGIAAAAGERKRGHALALEGLRQKGVLAEKGMMEAGLGRRLGREQEFARPLETAKAGYYGAETGRLGAREELGRAEAGRIRYGTEFERGVEGTLEDIIGLKKRVGTAKAEELELGLTEERRRIGLRDEAEAGAARPLAPEISAVPKTKREWHPTIKGGLYSLGIGRPPGQRYDWKDFLEKLYGRIRPEVAR